MAYQSTHHKYMSEWVGWHSGLSDFTIFKMELSFIKCAAQFGSPFLAYLLGEADGGCPASEPALGGDGLLEAYQSVSRLEERSYSGCFRERGLIEKKGHKCVGWAGGAADEADAP